MHDLQQRRTYAKEVKQLRLEICHLKHVKVQKKAKRALKRLRTITGTLLREAELADGSHFLELEEMAGLFFCADIPVDNGPVDGFKSSIKCAWVPRSYTALADAVLSTAIIDCDQAFLRADYLQLMSALW